MPIVGVYNPPSDILRVAVSRNPPDAFDDCKTFPQFEPTVDCLFPGWCLEVLKMITQNLNVTIEPYIMPYVLGSVDWGTLQDNGIWSGNLGMLQNNTVDTICLMFQKTDARSESFGYATTVITVRPIYVTKQNPKSYADLAANVYRSFNLELWMYMFGLTFIQMCIFLFISRVQSRLFDPEYWSPMRILWMLYEYFVDQKNDNEYPDPPSLSGKITLTVWAFCQCVIMSSLYRGILLSQLLNPIETKPFSNVDEMIALIAQKQYKLTTNYMGNWYFDELQRSNDSHYVSLRAATEDNPVVLAASVDDALDLVESGGYIYPIQEDSTSMQLAKQRCNLVFISEGLPTRTSHFVFAQNSSWLKAWNEQIYLTEDFQHRTFSKYFEDGFYPSGTPENCEVVTIDPQGGAPLDILSVLGILLMFAGGIFISIISFVAEKIVKYRRKVWQLKFTETAPMYRTISSSSTNRFGVTTL